MGHVGYATDGQIGTDKATPALMLTGTAANGATATSIQSKIRRHVFDPIATFNRFALIKQAGYSIGSKLWKCYYI
jgi:hypothetical protein